MFWTKFLDDAFAPTAPENDRHVGAPAFGDHVHAYTPPIGTEEQLEAVATRTQAEKMLTAPKQGKDGTTTNVSGQATEAMDLLVSIPEDQRGKMIDGLDDKAFQALMTNVPESERERFSTLVDSSQDPKRKLRMWREFHDATLNNDLDRYKKLDRGTDEDDSTKEQRHNQQRYANRMRGAKDTHAEVDMEMALLAEKEKAGTLSIADIDEMRGRKDLELKVELEHNVNLTAQQKLRDNGERVTWSQGELQQVDAALDQLPEDATRNGETLPQIMRTAPGHFTDTRSGQYFTKDRIEIVDNANTNDKDRTGGERQLVNNRMRLDHGDTVGSLEYTLTHEIGHDAAVNHQKAFKKFQAASGWKEVNGDAVGKTGLTERQIENIDNRRRKAIGEDDVPKGVDIGANGKIFTPNGEDKGRYWQVDGTAIPSREETGTERWTYGKDNPQEHFAEVYAKAVHLPETLYKDLVDNPAKAATTARGKVTEQQHAIAELRKHPTADSQSKITALEGQMAQLETAAATAETAQKQRGDQFGIMRNDVFHTDDAVKDAVARMRERKYSEAAITKFQQQAARVSTPAQVAKLEGDTKR